MDTDEMCTEIKKVTKDNFDFDKIYDFCNKHRVDVIQLDDGQWYCFIDHAGEVDDNKAYHIDIHFMPALVFGIDSYLEAHNAVDKN